MPFGRSWYPTAARLPDGRVFLCGGFVDFTCSSGADVCYNPGLAMFNVTRLDAGMSSPWEWSVAASQSDHRIDPGGKDYTRVWLLPAPVFADGLWRAAAMMGYRGVTLLINLDADTPPEQRFFAPTNGLRPRGGCNGDSTATIVSTGELLSLGGCGSSWLDLYNPHADSWRSVDTGVPRNTAASLLLPDGTVLLLNGENGRVDQSAALSQLQSQAGDPRFMQVFHPLTMRVDTYPQREDGGAGADGLQAPFRGYHNSVALLKDGRVLVSGGVHQRGDIGCEQPHLRLLSPPYLSPLRGSAARPQWDRDAMAAFDQSAWPQFLNGSIEPFFMRTNGTIQVAVQPGVSLRCDAPLPPHLNGGVWSSGSGLSGGGVVLMALQAFTHAFDANQRYIPLEYDDQESNGTACAPRPATASAGTAPVLLRLRVPPSPAIIPGEYLLFLVSADGVPSEALHARVLAAEESAVSAYDYPSAADSGGVTPSGPAPASPAADGNSAWSLRTWLLVLLLGGGGGVAVIVALVVWSYRRRHGQQCHWSPLSASPNGNQRQQLNELSVSSADSRQFQFAPFADGADHDRHA